MRATQTANVSFIKNLPQELLNSVGTYIKHDIEQDDIRLYQRKTLEFRTIVDNMFPSMLIIDYNNIRQELKKYRNISFSLKEALGKEVDPKFEQRYKQFKFSDKEVDLIVDLVRAAVDATSASSLKYTQDFIYKELNRIVTYGGEQANILRRLKLLFDKHIYLTDISNDNRAVFLFKNFADLTQTFTSGLDKAFNLVPVPGVESLGDFLDYGHTAVGYIEGETTKVQFNSPKVINVIFDVINQTTGGQQGVQAAEQASVNFLTQTKQVEEYVTVTKEFSEGFIKVFVSIGGNIVRFENSAVNQLRGSVLERNVNRQSAGATIKKLGELIGQLGGTLATEIKRKMVLGRGSPNVLDYMVNSIISAIRGETIEKFTQRVSKTNRTTTKVKVPTIVGITTGAVKFKRPAKRQVAKPVIKVEGKKQLLALENLLNGNLVQTVKQNMGTGSRRDILNLRSGRFAESVKLQRLTQGREGMITAYYSYMQNPYATFSGGGKQQYPRSRDPKLLISRSIRELAIQAKVTRLRAILV